MLFSNLITGPGNIRELKNFVERLLIMVNREIILPMDVIEILPLEKDQAQTLDAAAAYQTEYTFE